MNATIRQLQDSLTRTIEGLSVDKTQVCAPAKWNIQQIVGHLLLTYDATTSVVADRIAKGRPTLTKPSFAQHCGRLLILRAGYFPPGRQAPAPVVPPHQEAPLAGDQLATKVAEHLESMDTHLSEAERLFGSKRRSVSHIVLGPLSPEQWRRFHLVHGLHHLQQIEVIRRLQLPTS